MRWSSTAATWWRLPSRLALLMGLGALSTASAEAGVAGGVAETLTPRVGGAATQFGEPAAEWGPVVRIRGGTVEIAESGGPFREVRLGDTIEARRLKRLLEADPAARSEAGLRLGPTILAGSGGEGFHWVPDLRDPRDGARPVRSDNPGQSPAASGKGAPRATPKTKPDASPDKG